jgi:tRNA pseudouridine55 synthase
VINGLLPVDKPAGWTSHDVIARLRRVSGQKAVGHAGTLDPLATGVLVVMFGNATKLSQYLADSNKEYMVCVGLGATTLTDDAEAPLETRSSGVGCSWEEIEAVLRTFVGRTQQLPPRYAAVRHDGQKLYQLARKGVAVERTPRTVTIHSFEPLDWMPPRLTFRMACGAGTYVRSLARDIGEKLRVGGYLHALQRIESGGFRLRECIAVDALQTRDDVLSHLYAADRALTDWRAAVLDETALGELRQGRSTTLESEEEGNLRVYDNAGRLVALCRLIDGVARPFRVFDGGR